MGLSREEIEGIGKAAGKHTYLDPPGGKGNNMPVIIDKDDPLDRALEKINQKIESRRSYGVRREELPTTKKAHKLVWSNARASWYVAPVQDEIRCADSEEITGLVDQSNIIQRTCDYSRANMDKITEVMGRLRELEKEGKTKCRFVPSKTQCLDANEVAVIGVPKRVLESIVPLLNDLPLYAGSFEARERGVFSLRGIEIPPPLKEAWLKSMVTGQPLDIQSQIAIERKIQED